MKSNPRCGIVADTILHKPSGLRLMPLSVIRAGHIITHTVEVPAACCPATHNPLEGSMLTLSYVPMRGYLEVYTLKAILRQFVGGFAGNANYPAERNMEGMILLISQMAADALQSDVLFAADLKLDTGGMRIAGTAHQSAATVTGVCPHGDSHA